MANSTDSEWQDAEIARLKGEVERLESLAHDRKIIAYWVSKDLAACRKVIEGAYSYAREMQEQDINYGNVDIGDTLHELILMLCKDEKQLLPEDK